MHMVYHSIISYESYTNTPLKTFQYRGEGANVYISPIKGMKGNSDMKVNQIFIKIGQAITDIFSEFRFMRCQCHLN